MTWNILAPGWFNKYQSTYGLKLDKKSKAQFHKNRLNNIIKVIQEIDPDILCLQEVTNSALNAIKKTLMYEDNDTFISNGNVAKEGVATLCKSDINVSKVVKFIDSENEPNVYIVAKKNKKEHLILNVHLPRGGKTLDSLNYSIDYSDKKIQKIIQNKKSSFIICGDFNSSNKMTEEIEKKYRKYYWSKSTVREYGMYSVMLAEYNMFDISKSGKHYTTKKVDNIVDHEDHIFMRKGMKYRLYYGDYLKTFNPKKVNQGEKGLLHFAPNISRKGWSETFKRITSDHRWMGVDIKL